MDKPEIPSWITVSTPEQYGAARAAADKDEADASEAAKKRAQDPERRAMLLKLRPDLTEAHLSPIRK